MFFRETKKIPIPRCFFFSLCCRFLWLFFVFVSLCISHTTHIIFSLSSKSTHKKKIPLSFSPTSNMGSFLDKPVTTKFTEFRETKDFVWVVASMQGWRAEMEDAHTCVSEERDAAQHHFFGVFDGHGGKNAAKLSAKGLYDKVRDNFKTDSTEDPLYEAKKCGDAVRFRRTLSLSLSRLTHYITSHNSWSNHSRILIVTFCVTHWIPCQTEIVAEPPRT